MTFIQQLIFNVVILGSLAAFVYVITHGKSDSKKNINIEFVVFKKAMVFTVAFCSFKLSKRTI